MYYVTRCLTDVSTGMFYESNRIFLFDSSSNEEREYSWMEIDKILESEEIVGFSKEEKFLDAPNGGRYTTKRHSCYPVIIKPDAKSKLLRGYQCNYNNHGELVTVYPEDNVVVRLSDLTSVVKAFSIPYFVGENVTFILDDGIEDIEQCAFANINRGYELVRSYVDLRDVSRKDLLFKCYETFYNDPVTGLNRRVLDDSDFISAYEFVYRMRRYLNGFEKSFCFFSDANAKKVVIKYFLDDMLFDAEAVPKLYYKTEISRNAFMMRLLNGISEGNENALFALVSTCFKNEDSLRAVKEVIDWSEKDRLVLAMWYIFCEGRNEQIVKNMMQFFSNVKVALDNQRIAL